MALISKFQNAFSDRLSPFGFNIFSALLPDVMHEFALGGWKALLIHLLRILQSVDNRLLVELNCRYDYLQFSFPVSDYQS